MTLGLVFAVVETAVVLVLLAVFGNDNRRPVEMARVAVPHALATALFAPSLFRLAQRLRQNNTPARPQAEGAT
jgi:rod shape-determining protein MreD